ncbi:response regulator [Nonomuraea insulae]|uniref:Response regulator n=1 Tax=Nonomuraea insulae TaxID=1616787 RepID=A0ABW1CGN3_9ACTN
MTIRVIIADDQAMVRAGFAAILQAQDDIDVVGEAGDGRQAIELSERLHPDIVLMDIRMPHMDGLQATQHLMAGRRAPRVLILTTFDVDEYVYDALLAGASGFLLKGARPEELTAAVRVIAAGDALLSPSITRRLIADFTRARAVNATPSPQLDVLTPRERHVLTLMAQGLSNTEIAAALFIAEQTVKAHVSSIFTKLGLRDRAQAVAFAFHSRLIPLQPSPR